MKIGYKYLLAVVLVPSLFAQDELDVVEELVPAEVAELAEPHIEEIVMEGLETEVKVEVPVEIEDEPVLLKIPPTTETADEGIHLQVVKRDVVEDQEAAEVIITAPWPAKPDTNLPENWVLSPAPESLDDFKKTVQLENGKPVDLTITPFVLVPNTQDQAVVRILEPGFEPSQYLEQHATVGSLFESTTKQLEEKEKQAAAVINNLQQLLSSLPK